VKAAPQEQTKGFSFVSRHPMGVRKVLARTNKLTSADMALEMLCSSEVAAAMDAHARASGSSSSSTWATRTSVGLGQVRLHEGWGRESDHPTWRSRDKIEAEERRMNGTRERERDEERGSCGETSLGRSRKPRVGAALQTVLPGVTAFSAYTAILALFQLVSSTKRFSAYF
jgi:hypothetical protein